MLTEGVHSGSASGVVPSSFRVLRKLLSRIEDEDNGKIILDALHVDIPAERVEQATKAAETLGELTYRKYPWAVDEPSPERIAVRAAAQ